MLATPYLSTVYGAKMNVEGPMVAPRLTAASVASPYFLSAPAACSSFCFQTFKLFINARQVFVYELGVSYSHLATMISSRSSIITSDRGDMDIPGAMSIMSNARGRSTVEKMPLAMSPLSPVTPTMERMSKRTRNESMVVKTIKGYKHFCNA